MVCPQGKESLCVEAVVNHCSQCFGAVSLIPESLADPIADLRFALINTYVALSMVVIPHAPYETVGIFQEQSPDVVAIEDRIDYLKALLY